MGDTISQPLIDETPKDFMIRNNQTFFAEPYLDPLPLDGLFKDEDMCKAKDVVFGNWGDPNWNFDYRKESYKT